MFCIDFDAIHERLRQRGKAKSSERIFHVFVVEGLIDVLRLESIGLSALGALGNQLTGDQNKRLAALAKEVEGAHLSLSVHLFFDADEAGRRGLVSSIPQLLRLAGGEFPFHVDVIVPDTERVKAIGHDPDELFRHPDTSSPMTTLSNWSFSVLEMLMADRLGCHPNGIDEMWLRKGAIEQRILLRDIERLLETSEWRAVLARCDPLSTSLPPLRAHEPRDWRTKLERFLDTTATQAPPEITVHPPIEIGDQSRVLHALQIAHSSTQRREIPIDEGSWTRLQRPHHVTVPFLSRVLRAEAPRLEPLLGIKIPKQGRNFRLTNLGIEPIEELQVPLTPANN